MNTKPVWFGAMAVLTFTGCGQPIAQAPPTPAVPPATVVQPQVIPPPVIAPPIVTPSETVKAEAGVTGKGKDYGGGIITEPVRQYFRVQERVVFEIQLPHALTLYKAMHDDKAPETHDEYWKEIVQANGLEGKMPKLPPGHTYIYDPKTEELMVRRPATQP